MYKYLFASMFMIFALSANTEQSLGENFYSQSKAQPPRGSASLRSRECPYSYANPLEKGYAYAEGEWIYWRTIARVPYAAMVTIARYLSQSTQRVESFANDTRELDNRFQYTSGYKVKLGVDLPYSGWNFFFQYLKIADSTSDSATGSNVLQNVADYNAAADGTKFLFPYWWTAKMLDSNEVTTDGIKVDVAISSQQINYRLLDWQLNKTVYMKESFSLTPFLGLRSSWIRNQKDIAYTGFTDSATASRAGIPVQNIVRLINSFYGGGLLGGISGNWILGGGFEVFGKTALSGLLGKLMFQHRQDFITSSGVQYTKGSVTQNDKWKRINPVLEIALGLNWGMRFYKDKLYFGIKGSYNLHHWFDFFRFNRYQLTDYINRYNSRLDMNRPNVFAVYRSALTLHGYSLGAKLDF